MRKRKYSAVLFFIGLSVFSVFGVKTIPITEVSSVMQQRKEVTGTIFDEP